MHRPSMFLTLMQQAIQPHADDGSDLPAEVVPPICELLRLLSFECERMERRLSGEPLSEAVYADGKIVSLSAWATSKGTAMQADGGDSA